ncbi:hypothetical protein R1sor_000964 [Riccia sorocarpa]|uniref:Uncharacterized protein n=1 Tax=Riccia sorocarpa TaxID=122646 RepID=A0ABD3GXS3_9MARC
MGLPPVLEAAPLPHYLGPQEDGTTMDVKGCNGDTGKDWHSVSVSKPEVEYHFELLESKDRSDAGGYLSLCGLSKLVDSKSGTGGEGERALSDLDSCLTKNESSSPYITMETRDSSTGVKEVRVSFHGLDDSQQKSDKQDMGYNAEDGCLPLVAQLRSLLSGAKLPCGVLLPGDGKNSLLEGLNTVLHSFRTSGLSQGAPASVGDFNTNSGEQPKTLSNPEIPKSRVTEFPRRTVSEDLQARCDAFPLAHYRPDCPVWCSREEEQKSDGDASPVPSPNFVNPVTMNCKKPPKPPKPPRYPGKSASLDSATAAAITAAKAAAARRKALKQAAAKRKARIAAPPNSGGTPVIALLLTIGFGLLMVFQGLFVQNTSSNDNNEKIFVDVPSNEFGGPLAGKPNAFGLPYLDPEVRSSSLALDPGQTDVVVSNAIYKSMLEIETSRVPQGSDPTVALR